MALRSCPLCGEPPTRTYDYTYAYGPVRTAYCSPCRYTYGVTAVDRPPPGPEYAGRRGHRRALPVLDLRRWIGYRPMHKRVKRWRGKATAYRCVDCGRHATQWSYRGGSSTEVCDRKLMPTGAVVVVRYSTNVLDYDPRCGGCHNRHDGRGGKGGKQPAPAAAVAP